LQDYAYLLKSFGERFWVCFKQGFIDGLPQVRCVLGGGQEGGSMSRRVSHTPRECSTLVTGHDLILPYTHRPCKTTRRPCGAS